MKVEASYSFDVPEELVQEVIQKTAEKEVSKRAWIPVTERLPELTEQIEGDDFLTDYSKDVIVFKSGDPRYTRNIQIGRYVQENCHGEGFKDEYFDPINDVTHWMPLPDPPGGTER